MRRNFFASWQRYVLIPNRYFWSMAFTNYTPVQSVPKIKQYCAYQERCHAEVKNKLYSFGLNKSEIDEIISILITENYLNEERFAIHYAGGKFRVRQWGKIKIKQALKLKQVSDYCIKKALKEIDSGDYKKIFYKLVDQKLKALSKEKNIFIKKRKLQDYLMSKGFESELIREVVNGI
ncbi:MAG: regulatory protein RecX [Ginsengibacter sp.]